jgi:23S rRNA (guanosine2251-2'-O)-methyltransferase
MLRPMARTLAGIHAVRHALDSGQSIRELVIEKGKQHPRLNELVHLARQAGIPVHFSPRQALERLAAGVPHQGVVAQLAGEAATVDFKAWLDDLEMDGAPLLLLLDQVTDPHNLGACVRTAEAAGCAAVIVPRDHAADLDSPVVAKSACGALSRLPVIAVTNLVRSIEALQDKGFWVCGLAGEAESDIYAMKLTGPLALVMGAEGAGLRRLVRERCDQLLRIPMPGSVESLNVSVATGVALFEAVRQRQG